MLVDVDLLYLVTGAQPHDLPVGAHPVIDVINASQQLRFWIAVEVSLTATLTYTYLAVVGVLMQTDAVPCDHVTEFGGVQNVQ